MRGRPEAERAMGSSPLTRPPSALTATTRGSNPAPVFLNQQPAHSGVRKALLLDSASSRQSISTSSSRSSSLIATTVPDLVGGSDIGQLG